MGKIILTLYVLSATYALIALKLGSTTGLPVYYADHRLHFTINGYLILGFVLYGLSFLTYMYLIAKNDLGYIIPLAASFVYILLFTSSYFILNEEFSALKISGILLILVGIVFLQAGK